MSRHHRDRSPRWVTTRTVLLGVLLGATGHALWALAGWWVLRQLG